MKFIVVGCGRMGAGLAGVLSGHGHLVAVVDRDPEAVQRLGASLKGRAIIGSGFDRDVLVKAGVERADGLAAVTDNDETNVVVARLARELFKVPRVVARLYEPRNAEIYRRLGVQIISQTSWGINRVAELLCYSSLDTVMSFGSGEVEIVEAEVPALLVGRTVHELTIPGEVHVVAIGRRGKTFLPVPKTIFNEGDLVHVAVLIASVDRLRTLLMPV